MGGNQGDNQVAPLLSKGIGKFVPPFPPRRLYIVLEIPLNRWTQKIMSGQILSEIQVGHKFLFSCSNRNPVGWWLGWLVGWFQNIHVAGNQEKI